MRKTQLLEPYILMMFIKCMIYTENFRVCHFLFNFFPPQKVAKSASIKLVLNNTKIVLHVR